MVENPQDFIAVGQFGKWIWDTDAKVLKVNLFLHIFKVTLFQYTVTIRLSNAVHCVA
jgi:hypothetical protein